MPILAAGDRAPSFDLQDSEGVAHSLEADTRGGLALLAFFSLECRACDLSYLFWDRMHEAYAEAGCPVLAISLDGEEQARQFYERSGVSFPVLADEGRALAEAYGLECTPSLFFVDSGGVIFASHDAFDRQALNDLSAAIARRVGVPAATLAPGEAPDFSPGCTIHG